MLPFGKEIIHEIGAETIYVNDFRKDDIYEKDETNNGADAYESKGWFR